MCGGLWPGTRFAAIMNRWNREFHPRRWTGGIFGDLAPKATNRAAFGREIAVAP
jgi:hypothetical protein